MNSQCYGRAFFPAAIMVGGGSGSGSCAAGSGFLEGFGVLWILSFHVEES